MQDFHPFWPDQSMGVLFDNICCLCAGEREVLAGVSISVPPGTSCAIVGPSGSGKSTLLRLLMRLYDATTGQVRWPLSAAHASLPTCFAKHNLASAFSVASFCHLPACVHSGLAAVLANAVTHQLQREDGVFHVAGGAGTAGGH